MAIGRRTPVVDDMNGMVPTGKAKVGANLQGDRRTLIAVAPCIQLVYDTNATKFL